MMFVFNLMRFWFVVFMRFLDRDTFFLGTANQRASAKAPAPPHPCSEDDSSGAIVVSSAMGLPPGVSTNGCHWNSDAGRNGEVMYKKRCRQKDDILLICWSSRAMITIL